MVAEKSPTGLCHGRVEAIAVKVKRRGEVQPGSGSPPVLVRPFLKVLAGMHGS